VKDMFIRRSLGPSFDNENIVLELLTDFAIHVNKNYVFSPHFFAIVHCAIPDRAY